jgi:hypothetical protein
MGHCRRGEVKIIDNLLNHGALGFGVSWSIGNVWKNLVYIKIGQSVGTIILLKFCTRWSP